MSKRSRAPRSTAPSVDTARLRATVEATGAFAAHHASRFLPDFYRQATFGLTTSSVGIGTYLGESTDAEDEAYEAAIAHAVKCGINLIDTAINYRCQRSERSVGAALQEILADGAIGRDAVVISTKGGYIPLDSTQPATREEYQAYVTRHFIEPRIVDREEIVAGGHSLAPRFIRYCLAQSRQNLGLRTVDIYYLHNPEQQLTAVGANELMVRLRGVFAVLEEAADRGEIGVYGAATWDGLRAAPDSANHLSLEAMVEAARQVGGADHRFRAVQLPINLAMPEAVRNKTQLVGGEPVSVMEAADRLGLSVFASAPLMQGRLTTGLPPAVAELFPGTKTDAERALAFVRSVPGLTAALFGARQIPHVDANLAACMLAEP